MSTIRRFCCNDLLRFSSVNLEHLTITSGMCLYMKWLAKWPNYSHVAIAPGNRIMGYFLGGLKKKNPARDYWRGLAIFVNVASEYRRMKLGTRLMGLFEKQMVEKMLSTKSDDHYFIFLYFGVSNTPAFRFFTKIGFIVPRTIPTFYFKNDEHAVSMYKEVAEERRQPRGVIRNIELCSFCKEKKKENCSYVCLPRIV